MMEIEDKEIRRFFSTEKKEIEDNGFSRRVMRCLPGGKSKVATLWSLLVTLAAGMLFFAFDGLTAVLTTLREVFISMIENGTHQLDLRSLLIAAVVLLFWGIRNAWLAD